MADNTLGAYNIFDLRDMALIGCRSIADLGPEYLRFVDGASQRVVRSIPR